MTILHGNFRQTRACVGCFRQFKPLERHHALCAQCYRATQAVSTLIRGHQLWAEAVGGTYPRVRRP